MYRILVPVDGSDEATQALRHALSVAKRCTATSIELLNVQPELRSGLVRAHLSADAIATGLQAMGESTLQPCRKLLDAGGIGYRASVEIGPFAATIVQRALAVACDEIYMGSRGMGAAANLVLGSVAMQVAHLSALPVTLVKGGADPQSLLDPVLVPLDGSEHANRAVGYVIERAHRCGGARIELVHVQDPVVEWQTHGLAKDAIRRERQEYALQLTETARRLLDDAGLPYTLQVEFGDPAQTIAAAAARGFARVVMGTRGLGGWEALVLGSVAYKTIHGTRVPVTLVR